MDATPPAAAPPQPAPPPPAPHQAAVPAHGDPPQADPPHGPAAAPPHTPPSRAVPPHGAPPPLARRVAAPLGLLAGAAAAFAFVAAVDPNEPGHYPACPLLQYTGLYCPGCGGLRSAHAFAHGDLATALGANAMAVAGYAVFAALMLVWLVKAVRGVRFHLTVHPVAWWVLGTGAALFCVIRNLPFGASLAP
ncbi:DUF2752 domain-containing protein [Streptomyces sp. CC228A]|uniref:DUF2752 domain-containing protein n=1 Tax=Streptomyces sp. CC228A TaxID=2898186 RepID=UPI001F28AB74|nr:DUF2752 domain-containing protein [Streptomyces sp. CC228A]